MALCREFPMLVAHDHVLYGELSSAIIVISAPSEIVSGEVRGSLYVKRAEPRLGPMPVCPVRMCNPSFSEYTMRALCRISHSISITVFLIFIVQEYLDFFLDVNMIEYHFIDCTVSLIP
jgi:hypothetical protein